MYYSFSEGFVISLHDNYFYLKFSPKIHELIHSLLTFIGVTMLTNLEIIGTPFESENLFELHNADHKNNFCIEQKSG